MLEPEKIYKNQLFKSGVQWIREDNVERIDTSKNLIMGEEKMFILCVVEEKFA